MGRENRYGPEGILVLPKGHFQPDPDRTGSFIFFGRFAAKLQRLRDKYGVDPEVSFRGAIELMGKTVDAFSTGKIVVMVNEDGDVVQKWNTLEELLRHVEREDELRED